jgi:hypothetical protein
MTCDRKLGLKRGASVCTDRPPTAQPRWWQTSWGTRWWSQVGHSKQWLRCSCWQHPCKFLIRNCGSEIVSLACSHSTERAPRIADCETSAYYLPPRKRVAIFSDAESSSSLVGSSALLGFYGHHGSLSSKSETSLQPSKKWMLGSKCIFFWVVAWCKDIRLSRRLCTKRTLRET